MPAYERDGACEIAFASQKQYISISFYLMRSDVREAFEERLAEQNMGKGCLRFRRPHEHRLRPVGAEWATYPLMVLSTATATGKTSPSNARPFAGCARRWA